MRAVAHESHLLECFVTEPRDKTAASKFSKRTHKRHGPIDEIVTDRLRSNGRALCELAIFDKQEIGPWANNRAQKNESMPWWASTGCERYERSHPCMPVIKS